MLRFKKIGLIAKHHANGVAETLTTIKDYLCTLPLTLVVEAETASLFSTKDLTVVKAKELHHHCELIIVIGGDGSLLHAAHIAVNQNLPVLGINRGRLGFLTDIKPDELEKIGKVLTGECNEEQRFLLDCQIEYENKIINTDFALNDVVLVPGQVVNLIEFKVCINQQFMCDYRADGLIVATPTGSTAYALSGGGPILHPTLDALVLVPMFAHTLSSRPIVIQGNSEIVIKIDPNNDIAPCVSCDGQKRITAPVGSSIRIRKKAETLRLIHPLDYHYYETLRAKLGWYK